MSKHTPGPWIAWDTGDGMGIVPKESYKDALVPNVAAFAAEICRLRVHKMDPLWDQHWEEQKANARLIAAAPELLEFVKGMAAYFKANPNGYEDYLKFSQALIAKAEGRSNG